MLALPHLSTIGIRFAELDPYGHLNHAMYLTYCEQGRAEALQAAGLSLASVADAGFQFVVTEVHAQFLSPATGQSPVVVHTRLEDLRRVSGVWVQEMTDPDCSITFFTSRVRAGVTNSNGRPARPPRWVTEGLQRLVLPSPEPTLSASDPKVL